MKDVGIVGLGVMGKSLAINMATHGYKVSGYNRTDGRINDLLKEGNDSGNIYGAYSLEELVQSLKKPRVIFLMTKSGSPVDEMIEKLIPLLEINDIIIDGGNSYYKDTIRRDKYLKSKKIRFLGVGVSGGEEGALRGPSIMVGGNQETYEDAKKILTLIAAESKYGKCCALLGNHGSGHYVKMVHNGIEYGMMQAIAEVYQLLKDRFGYKNKEISEIFGIWNKGILNSYLLEISIDILVKKDDDSDMDLVDLILDKAEQNGTGAWTMESALKLGVPTPTLNAAVVSRNLSHYKEIRQELSSKVSKPICNQNLNNESYIKALEDTLIFTNYLIFSQGIWLIDTASKELKFQINIVDVLKVWTNGCIIRARLLDEFIKILESDQSNVVLLNNKKVLDLLDSKVASVTRVLNLYNESGISASAISSAIDYYYSLTTLQSPMNLIQAQRDYFGSHTYKRIDKEGVYHSNWNDK